VIAAFVLFFILGISSAFAQQVDCSIPANATNPYCNFKGQPIERGCNCFDNVDNDGDGLIDRQDVNCAEYYGLTFVGGNASCPFPQDPSANPFAGIGAPAVSGQNTADTQSKVSVGDVDGDGVPDAVITSKWNSEIRVVATTNGQADGSDAGDIKSDYKTTGQGAKIFSGTGGCKPTNLLFEHENLIADINKDGKAELFGVVSNRGGNPSTPPTCFFLVGFRYAPDDLVPLYNAINLGTNRPGTFGIADMDGDGRAEIYLRDRIYAAETGALLATGNGNWDLDVTSAPVAVNVLGDNKMELVCGTKIFSIPSLTNRNPATPAALTLARDMNTITANKAFVKLTIDPVEYGEDTHSSCSVADIDRDGFIDVIISGALNSVTGPTSVFYWNVQKNTVSFFSPPDPSYANGWPWGTGRVNIGDANGDGRSDLSFIAGARLWCMTTDAGGNIVPLWAAPRVINDTRSGVLTVTIYDFNNDGKPEMVYRDSQELVVIDGTTGTVKQWSAVCQSHTYTEGPIIADVNGDGATDICVPCNRNNSFDINDPIQQQALGEVRLFFSNATQWLPTRKVWNQPGYFVVNIKDDLTLPFPQLDQNLIFSNTPCPNGVPGPQMPLNVFLNQVPFMGLDGCPLFPRPDLAFDGDVPGAGDTNGDGVVTPAVEVIPPVCGDLAVRVRFNIINSGDLPISDNVPVSFFQGDPRNPGLPSDSLLFTTTIAVANLGVGQTYTTPYVSFNTSGKTFRMYIVLNNNGSVLPIDTTTPVPGECSLSNNVYDVLVDPSPFTAKIEKVNDNFKCADTAPDNGHVRVRIFRSGVEVTDYSPYAFQWYRGTALSNTIITGATNYNLTPVAEGDYTVIVRNTLKNCQSQPQDTLVLRTGVDPVLSVQVVNDQTKCNPPDGHLRAVIAGGTTGYTFAWFDIGGTALGVTGTDATNLVAGNYIVQVSKDGCTENATGEVRPPTIPDATASTLANVVDCLNPNSGSVTATALFNGVAENPANYQFDWYFFNGGVRGSILPPANGTGPTRTGLAAGTYQVVVRNTITNCVAVQTPTATVGASTVLPTVSIAEIAPQTSCDPLNPNGIIQATASAAGFTNPNDFTFQWFRGDNTLPANLVTTTSGVKGETLNQVAGGGITYTVKVTTPLNCSATNKIIITENVQVPVLSVTPTPNSNCDPLIAAYNGALASTVTFGGAGVTLPNTNYRFTWYNGDNTSAPVITVADNTVPNLTQLNGGNYTVVVERTDLACRSLPQTRTVLNAQVLPTITTVATPSTNCVGGTVNGAINVTSVTPAGPYTYRWFDKNNTLLAGVNTSSISGRQGGLGENFTVEVTLNSSGCKSTVTTNIPDNKANPALALTPFENSICDATIGFNGSITSTLTDVNALPGDTYNYAWSTGNDMSSVILGQTASSLSNRNGGFYTATIRNVRTNCVSNPVTTQIVNNQILPAIVPALTPSTNCAGGNPNGGISVTISNAAPAQTFTFDWRQGSLMTDPAVSIANGGNTSTISNQQGNQNYIVQVRNNQTGCVNTSINLLPDNAQPPVLTLNTANNTTCDPAFGFTGSVSQNTLTDPNALGTDTYVYAWSTGSNMSSIIAGATSNSITARNGGFYTATVRNTRTNCTSNPVTAEINNLLVYPAITATPVGSTNCPGGTPNGRITVSVTNAVVGQTFSHQWYQGIGVAGATVPNAQGGNTATAINLQGGNSFTVEVVNNTTGCETVFTENLQDLSQVPVLSLTPTANTICVPNPNYDGSIASTFTDANGLPAHTYTYAWSTGNNMSSIIAGQTSASLTQRNAGFYTATIRNNTLNCTSSPVTVEILNNQILPAIATTPTGSTNCVGGTPNGSITASVTNGLGGQTFAFAWFQGNLTTDPAVSAAQGGNTATITGQQGGNNFTVQATINQTGCTNTRTLLLPDNSQIPVLSALLHTDNLNCTAPFNGTVTLDTTTPFVYRSTTITSPFTGFTLNWSNGTTGTANQITALGANTYSVTVTANNNPITGNNDNCVSAPVFVTVLDNLTYPAVNVAKIDQSSCNPLTPNGRLTATVGGGTAGHSFQWFSGIGIAAPATDITNAGTPNIAANLASGDYTTRVENTSTRCVSTVTLFVPDNIVNPEIAFTGIQDVTACVPPNGAATPIITNASTLPTPNFTIRYVRTFSSVSEPGTPPSDPAVILASPDVYTSTATIVNGTNPPVVNNLQPGYLTAIVVDNNTQCVSTPATVQIQDRTLANQINIGAIVAAGFCGGGGGSINVTLAGGTGAKTTRWFRGTPTNNNINFFNNPPVFGTGVIQTTTSLLEDEIPVPVGVGSGTYTLVVTDAVGCGAYHIDNVPFAGAPTITITETDPQRCTAPFDGSINVQVAGAFGPYSITFFQGNSATPVTPPTVLRGEICDDLIDNDGDGLIDNADPDCGTLNLTLNNIASGEYLIRVIDYTPANRPCPLDDGVVLIQRGFAPLVQVDDITPNTACNDAAFGDGTVELTVTQDDQDNRDPVATPVRFAISSVTPAPVNAPAFPAILSTGAATVTSTLSYGFRPTTYTLRVTETTSGCFTDQSVSIPDQPVVPQLLQVDVTNDTYCAPLSNGSAVVSAVNPIAVSDYAYTWYTDPGLTTSIYSANGTGAPVGPFGGERLDATKYAGWINPVNGLGIGTREYYVRGLRLPNTGAGAGCPTPAVKVVVEDEHVTPVATLSSTPNTSCDPANLVGEGSVSITTVTSSSDVAVANGLYSYSIAPDPNTIGLDAGNAGATPFVFGQLISNTYTIQATNEVSGCRTSGSIDVISKDFSLAITNSLFNNQLICNPDGDITVTQITIDRTVTGQPNQVFNAGLINDFDFRWYRANAATPGTFDPAQPLRDPVAFGNDVINNAQLTGSLTAADQEYQNIGAGTYYVIATRKTGPLATLPVVGFGCSTTPLRVDLQDQHINPVVSLAPFSDTSCEPTGPFEGEININVTDATAVGGPFTYDYAFTTTTSTTPVTTNPYNGTNNLFQQLENGSYNITVTNNQTGCNTTGSATIIKNTTPVFVTGTLLTPQFYCDPSGNITVTEVSFRDRNGATQIAPVADFAFAWARNGASLGAGITASRLDSLNYNTIGADGYSVVATRIANGPGLGCVSAPANVVIQDQRDFPVVTLTPFSNTSCTTAFEGEIEVDVVDASRPKVAPSPLTGLPFNYNYTWTAVSVAGGLPAQLTTGLTNPYNGTNNVFSQLQNGTYRVAVRNNATGCVSTAETEIELNQTPVFVQDVDMVPQYYCFESGNLEVRSIRFNDRNGATQNGPLGDFTYDWYRNTTTNYLLTTNGAAPRGTFLDSISYTLPEGIGAGTYYVVATRNTGTPGAGCKSAPFRIDIDDRRTNPVVSFATLANTACDGNFDGRITVNSNTLSGPGVGSNYDITWVAPIPTGSTIANATNVGASYNTLASDVIGAGTFTALVTNRTTQCATQAPVTMVNNPQPLDVLTVTKTDQLICYPDGSITVNTMSPGNLADYTFNWFRGTPGGSPLADAGSATIISNVLNTGNYPVVADTYYVVGIRNPGNAPGSGCQTPPFRVDIRDLHVDPVLTFTYTANSSCDPVNPNGIINVTAAETNGSTTDTYSFNWNMGGLLGTPVVVSNNQARVDDAQDGVFEVTVTNTSNTGCDITGRITVTEDLSLSLPNIVNTLNIDPTDCFPTGAARVVSISIGGTTTFTNPPDDLNTTFDFEWYKGNFTPASLIAGQVNSDLNNVVPDRYFVLVQDLTTACKSSPVEIVVDDASIVYPDVRIYQNQLQVSCDPALSSAVLSATADLLLPSNSRNNYANYDFFWYNSLDTVGVAINAVSDSTINQLAAGDYSVKVYDRTTNCRAKTLYIVPDDGPRFLPELALSTEDRENCLVPDGELLAREVGYDPNSGYPFTPNYTTELYTGASPDTSVPGAVMALVAGTQRSWLTGNLDVGPFTVKITDNNTGCVVIKTTTVDDGRTPPTIVIDLENPLTNCDPARANGQLSATADGGLVGGYTFDWYNGAAVAGAILQSGNKLIGQVAGPYTVRVTNNLTGCFDDETESITDETITPPRPNAFLVQDRTSCIVPDGWVSANVGGVVFNYTFNWYDGSVVGTTPDFTGPDYKDRDIGPYTVTATDDITGCVSNPATINVNDLRVIPNLIFKTTPAYCEEVPGVIGGGGTIELTTDPADIVSDDIQWVFLDNGASAGSGNYLTGLFPGTYEATLVTSKGCVKTDTANVATEIFSYNLVTVNGDDKNDIFRIDCITRFPNNNVKIFNRSGVLVYEADGYDNGDVSFKGVGEKGLYMTGKDLPTGTYFYIIDKGDGSKPKTGYLELVK